MIWYTRENQNELETYQTLVLVCPPIYADSTIRFHRERFVSSIYII